MDENKANFASWEKHTKGIGSKLLQKFGFNGRLGAREDGIAKAIEVTARQGSHGIGFGEDENRNKDTTTFPSSSTKRNIDLAERNKHKKAKIANDSESDSDGSNADNDDEFVDYFTTSQEKITKILDMRQNDPKMVTDFTGLNAPTMEEYKNSQLNEEIIYFRKVERHINDNKRKDLENANKMYSKYEAEVLIAEDSKKGELQRGAVLNELLTSLLQFHELIESIAPNNLNEIISLVKMVVLRLCDLYERFPIEYEVFGVNKILRGYLSQFVTGLNIDSIGEILTLKKLLDEYNVLVDYFKRVGKPVIAQDAAELLSIVLEQELLPLLRRYIASTWDPTTNLDIVECVDICRPLVAANVMNDLLDVILLPRLMRQVQAWNAQIPHVVPLHIWLLPWIPILGPKLSQVYPEIRRKLASYIKRWQPTDPTAMAWIEPWSKIFDPNSYENFIGQTIIPRLIDYLRNHLIIDPSDQDLIPIECVLRWKDIIPKWQLSFLFSGEVFPKWYRTLLSWLSIPQPGYREIAIWYSGWKSIFPKELLSDEFTMINNLNFALDMIIDFTQQIASTSDTTMQQKYLLLLPQIEKIDYYTLVKQHTMTHRLQEKHSLLQQQQQQQENTNTSLKEILEILAEKHNLEFKPKFNRFVEGKQVWEFGSTMCYIESNIVFVFSQQSQQQQQSREANNWRPVSLEDLVAQAAAS